MAADAASDKSMASELAQRIASLRNNIARAALAPGLDDSASPILAEVRKSHAALVAEMERDEQRASLLAAAKRDLESIESQQGLRRGDHAKAMNDLQSHGPALGRAAFDAYRRNVLAKHQLFAERIAAQERIEGWNKEIDQLNRLAGSSFFGRGLLAKGQQIVLAGKIKLEEFRLSKLEAEIGTRAIASQQEEAFACELTAPVLRRVKEARDIAAMCQQRIDESLAVIRGKQETIQHDFGLVRVGGVSDLTAEADRCRQSAGQKRIALQTLEREILSKLLAQPDSGIPAAISDLLRELAEAEAAAQGLAQEAANAALAAQDTALRALGEVVMSREDIHCRRYSDKNVNIGSLVKDLDDFIGGQVGAAARHLHEDDTWTFALGDRGGIVLKGQPNDLDLRVYVAMDPAELRSEMTRYGTVMAGMGAAGIAGGAAIAGTVAVGVLAPVLIPVALGAAVAAPMYKRAVKANFERTVQELVEHVDQLVKNNMVMACSAVVGATAPDIPAQIKKLAELKDLGAVTEEEFARKKSELLSRM